MAEVRIFVLKRVESLRKMLRSQHSPSETAPFQNNCAQNADGGEKKCIRTNLVWFPRIMIRYEMLRGGRGSGAEVKYDEKKIAPSCHRSVID